VFWSPQIPENTGTTARTCAATRLSLTLVGPLGFELSSARLKRAGLDYWASVHAATHPDWASFEAAAGPDARFVAFSTKGKTHYATPGLYAGGGGGGATTYLIFGSETAGLPPEAHAAAAARGAVVTLPIDQTHVRSLNLAVSAGVGIFEALRQVDGVV
jgi:tRNA (cytidine/uridine-2'-O-)-methyltransferase